MKSKFRWSLPFLAVFALSAMPTVSVVADEAKKEKSENKRVCKRVKVTGSRIKERICRTQRDWDHIAEESQETLQRNRDSRSVNTGGGDV